MSHYSLAVLAKEIGAEVVGNADLQVSAIATLAGAKASDISFLSNPRYRAQLSDTQAGAVIVSPSDAEYCRTNALVMKNPYLGFARVAQMLDKTPDAAHAVAETASVDNEASIGRQVSIGPNAVICRGAVIGDNVQIGPGCFIGENAQIGSGSKLWANVTVYHDCQIGSDCLVQSGAVIGSDGFGYANDAGHWIKIPQLGRVIIGDEVEIGANTCIDRGALDDTVIGAGVIIDNLCQIAHNVEVGAHTAIAGCTVVAGSTVIGKHCTIAGMVGINGHMQIADGVVITGFSMVTKSITEPGVYSSGVPATTNKEWRKNMVGLRNIGKLDKRVKELENRVESLDPKEME